MGLQKTPKFCQNSNKLPTNAVLFCNLIQLSIYEISKTAKRSDFLFIPQSCDFCFKRKKRLDLCSDSEPLSVDEIRPAELQPIYFEFNFNFAPTMEHITIENDMERNGENEIDLLCRLSYIYRITLEFSDTRDFELPTADEARSFDEALSHVVRLFPNNTGMKGCKRRKLPSRKESLKEILNALQCMERKRLYDPPADHEIRFYLVIKKYIRSMLMFFDARYGPVDNASVDRYACLSFFSALHHVDELVEVNRYFADFSTLLSDLDITNGGEIKPLMGIRDNYEVPAPICGSRERSNVFYRHKFELARLDIQISQHSFLPPAPQEQLSYLQVLDHLRSQSPLKPKGEVNVYSERLHMQLLEKIERETRDMKRHCELISRSIIDKLSINWKSIDNCFPILDRLFPKTTFANTKFEQVAKPTYELCRKLARMCPVSDEELEDYIACVERCKDVARTVFMIVKSRFAGYVLTGLKAIDKEFGWEALHALTLLKRGSVSCGNVFREPIMLRNLENIFQEPIRPRNLENSGQDMKMNMKFACNGAKIGGLKCLPVEGDEAKIGGLKRRPVEGDEAKTELKHCVEGNKAKIGLKHHRVEGHKAKTGFKNCVEGDEAKTGLKRCVVERDEAKTGLKRRVERDEAKTGLKRRVVECNEAKKGLKCCVVGCNEAKTGILREGIDKRNDNLFVLRRIVEELRRIGDSDVEPDEEERALIYKIWLSAASSVHFFLSAMAYEQRRYIIQRGGDYGKIAITRNIRTMRRKTKEDCMKTADELWHLYCGVDIELQILTGVLRAYACGLHDRLETARRKF